MNFETWFQKFESSFKLSDSFPLKMPKLWLEKNCMNDIVNDMNVARMVQKIQALKYEICQFYKIGKNVWKRVFSMMAIVFDYAELNSVSFEPSNMTFYWLVFVLSMFLWNCIGNLYGPRKWLDFTQKQVFWVENIVFPERGMISQ